MQAAENVTVALNGGYHAAFLFGAIFAAAAGVLVGLLLRPAQTGNVGTRPLADSDGAAAGRPAPTASNSAAIGQC